LPIRLQTVLERIPQITNDDNLKTVNDFSKYLLDSDIGNRHRINSLITMVDFAHWLGPRTFAQVRKAEVKDFLHFRRTKDGAWERITKDPEGRWVSTYNLHLAFSRRFFRWYYNRDKDEEEWKTPEWFTIKNEKSDRASRGPYTKSQVWNRDEVLSILKYESHPRNKAIITMGWDMLARNHEITSLRIRDINFGVSDVYAEGEIPDNTKTGGGEVVFGMSYPYVRDWYNQHPRKDDDDACFICNLKTYEALQPEAIWNLFERLKLRIKHKVESGSLDEDERKKMEFLLKRKAWNPYCMLRHSPITSDADYLPLTVITKKARWSQNSRQGLRYIKNTIGQEAKNKMLQAAGIKVPDSKILEPAVHQCSNPDCNYVNTRESEICGKCSTPLTPMAFDKRKRADEDKMRKIIATQTQELAAQLESEKQKLIALRDYIENMDMRMSKEFEDISSHMRQVSQATEAIKKWA
jgi:integrase/recombinase XerD